MVTNDMETKKVYVLFDSDRDIIGHLELNKATRPSQAPNVSM